METTLTRSEAAYLHLCSFRQGEPVVFGDREHSSEGAVGHAQQMPAGGDLDRAYLTIAEPGKLGWRSHTLTVAALLGGCFIEKLHLGWKPDGITWFDGDALKGQEG